MAKSRRTRPGSRSIVVLAALVAGVLAPARAPAQDAELPTVTVTAIDPEMSETGDPGAVEVARTGDTDSSLAVNYVSLYGDARRGVDYEHPAVGTPAGATGVVQTVVIPAGRSSATLTFVPRDDLVPEGPETIVVALSHKGRSYVVGEDAEATIVLADDEEAVAPAAPTDLTATVGPDDRVHLAWTDQSTNEDAFVVERRTTPDAEFAELARIGRNQDDHVDDPPAPEGAVGDLPEVSVEYRVRAVNDAGESEPTPAVGPTVVDVSPDARHVVVSGEAGRFKGWPANGGMWAWGDEIVVLYEDGAFVARANLHSIAFDEPIRTEQARSLDGGETWTVEPSIVKPGAPGFPTDGLYGPAVTDLATPVDFSAPDLAVYVQMSNKDYGQSYWYYSTDRARTWNGPYSLPSFGFATVNARTDYVVNGPSDIQLTLSGTNQANDEGGTRPFVVRSTDGGLTWTMVGPVGPKPTMQSSTVRAIDGQLVSTGRDGVVYSSSDNGVTWTAVSSIDAPGGPASLVRLDDGRIVAVYGWRVAPFGVRTRISDDDGATWGSEVILRADGGSPDLGYTRAVVRADGSVVAAYYFNDDSQAERTIDATIFDPDVVFGSGPDRQPAQGSPTPLSAPPAAVTQTGSTTGSVAVSFDPLGVPETNVQYSTDSGLTWCAAQATGTTARIDRSSSWSCQAPTLKPNTRFGMQMRFVNAAGSGQASPVVRVMTMPSAPTGLVQKSATTSQATVGFTAAGNATTRIEYTTNGTSWCPVAAAATASPVRITRVTNAGCTGSALAARTTYPVRLRIVNGPNVWNVGGGSAPLAVTTVPRAPTSLAVASASTTSLSVKFATPTGPAPLSNHMYSTDGGTTWCPIGPADTTSPVLITRVSASGCAGPALAPNTTYSVRIAAVDAGGRGDASSALTATTLPAPPTNLVGTVGTKSVKLSWRAPATAGGRPITDYVVQHSRDNVTWTTFADGRSTATSTTVTGLATRTRYFFRVAARTAAGQSAFVGTAPTTFTPR